MKNQNNMLVRVALARPESRVFFPWAADDSLRGCWCVGDDFRNLTWRQGDDGLDWPRSYQASNAPAATSSQQHQSASRRAFLIT